MGKMHVSHRVVVRDQDGKIITDLPFESHAEARPKYDQIEKSLIDGHTAALQHGARIIKRHPPKP